MEHSKVYKVLCLHGYRQDSTAFKTKSGGFRKLMKKHFIFEFIDAPNIIPKGEQNPDGARNCLSWWFSGENPDYFSSKHVSNFVKGFDHSLHIISEAFRTKGPFDGIMGFSQGGSLAVLLCLLRHFNEFEHDFKFVILASAFKSLTSSHVTLFDRLASSGQKMNIVSLHLIGQNDQVVEPSRSEWLTRECFIDSHLVLHSGGHTVPSQSSYREQYQKFINSL